MYSAFQKDVLFLLHENGSITIFNKQISQSNQNVDWCTKEPIGNLFNTLDVNFTYSECCQSDQLRLGKNSRVFGFAVCPTTETNIAMILNDGRVLKYELFNKVNFVYTFILPTR